MGSETEPGKLHGGVGALLRLGSHAIVMVDRRTCALGYTAAYLAWRDGNWQVQSSIGDVGQLPLPPERGVVPPEGETLDLPIPALSSTTRWVVVERGIAPSHTR